MATGIGTRLAHGLVSLVSYSGLVLWIRGLIFTLLVPAVVAGWVPQLLLSNTRLAGGLWKSGWLLIATGAAVYFVCLLSFLRAGGTPAISFTRPIRFLLGEAPNNLVYRSLYRFSNSKYLGVLLSIIGQATAFASWRLAFYAACLAVFFNLVVVFVEEPYLRKKGQTEFEAYCRQVSRWLGFSKRA